jgi:hypothetical protein
MCPEDSYSLWSAASLAVPSRRSDSATIEYRR